MNAGVYVRCFKGFGNKVFDFISALYLRRKYPDTEVYFAIDKSIYDTDEDPFFGQIFPKISADAIIKFMFMNKYKKLEAELPINEILINNLDDLPDNVTGHVRFINLHKFAYVMYSSFSDTDKQYFTINSKLISKKVEDISNTSYGCIHIRYGDKLCRSKYKYPVYTPAYYKLQIQNLLDADVPVYIITDTIDLVTEYIMPTFVNNRKVHLMDSGFVESFYLLTKAEFLILSHSTFSFSAAYINEMATCHIVKKVVVNDQDDYIFEDDAIDPNWVLIDEPRFILNTDQELIKEMISKTDMCQKYNL
uniref:Glycosyltransferase n=1 Tax=viral metagenome TaxID=1070528 RepID=A0A6C0C6J4_9ZZZZ